MGCKLSPIFLFFLIVSLIFGSYQIREVKAQSTFGHDPLGSPPAGAPIEDHICGSSFTCPEACTPLSITASLYTYSSLVNIKCAIYRESDDVLVAYTEQRSINVGSFTAETFDIVWTLNGLTNQAYYLVAWGDASSLLGDFFSSGQTVDEDSETYNSFPNPWNPVLESNNRESAIYCTYTTEEGQDLTFPLFENFNTWESLATSKEQAFTLFQPFNLWSSMTHSVETAYQDLYFTLFEQTQIWSSLATAKEQAFSLFENFDLWSSITMASEGVALDLYFTFFEAVNPFSSLATTITEELTLNDVYGLAALGFILAIVAICLAVAFKKR